MSPVRTAALFFAILLVPAVSSEQPDDSYLRIAKAIESFGEIFREVQLRYVDPVDPVELVDVGIDAMMEHLDPYSEYMVGDESEDVQNITTGSYVGVGIVVDEINGNLYISDLREGGSARESKIRIGDRIIRVDSAWADTLGQDGLRSYTRGQAGSKVSMWLLRDGKSDTIKVLLERRALELESIYAAHRFSSSIGYIKLTRFTSNTRDELADAIQELQNEGPLTGLILDLRDNPGGLLDAAIGITELFVPQGSAIVTTRGRSSDETRLYASNRPSKYPKLPLAVLINESSASASEVVAGALQDLDRAVIIGRRSYGKGFVQTMIPLSAGASVLKLTTARYYTPSGRCIQRLDTRNADSGSVDRFRTSNGRRVSARHGIDPDSTVSDSILPTTLANLEQSGAIAMFATRYAARFESLPDDFLAPKSAVEDFIRFVATLPNDMRDPLFQSIKRLEQAIDESAANQAIKSALKTLQVQVERDYQAQLKNNSSLLIELLSHEIRSRFSTGSIQYRAGLLAIPSVRAAHEVLQSPKYGAFLAPKLPSDQ
ncbi:MAG: S41 family peptidase [Ignavibacteria bacterium]|nr:S41 family peptidase [Ignavibacteria bacterium]